MSSMPSNLMTEILDQIERSTVGDYSRQLDKPGGYGELQPLVDKLNSANKTLAAKSASKEYLVGFGVVALGLLSLLFGIASWQSQTALANLQERVLQFEVLSGEVKKLDEVLTMSAKMGAATADLSWEKRYDQFAPILDKTIKALIKSYPELEITKQTDLANQRLVELERQSFALTKSGKTKEAYGILTSSEYETQKELYDTGMRKYKTLLDGIINERRSSLQSQSKTLVFFAFCFLVLSLAGWLFVFKRLRVVNFNLALLNDSLEKRVREQTRFLSEQADALQLRLSSALDLVTHLAKLDFTKVLEVKGDRSPMDGLAAGLNMLAEELRHSVVSKKELEQAKQQLELIADNIPGAISRIDANGNYLFANRAYEDWFGKSRTQIIGRHLQEVLPAKVYSQAEPGILKALGGEEVRFDTEIIKVNGKKIIARTTLIPYSTEGNLRSGYFVVAHDITELVNNEKALRQEKLKYENVVKGLNRSAIVAITDKKGTITFANDLFCEISGYPRHELIGANHRILKSGYHPPEFYEEMWRSIVQGGVWHGEVCNRRKNGSFYWVETTISPTTGENGEPQYMAIRYDITAKKDAHRKLIESSKMSSLGEMAGGIAHEINNPLAIIKGKAGFIKKQLPKEGGNYEKLHGELEKIEATAERIAKIIRGLRSFSRNAAADPMEIQRVSAVIEDTLELCRERFRNHSIDLRIEGNLDVQIECRPSQLSQVLINLLGNAHDAVEKLQERWVSVEVIPTESRVMIYVTDSGSGIPQPVVDKMMLPFFTTKEVGKGTGLGLSISKGIIEDHQGEFYYDTSSPNTRFVLELPLSQQHKTPLQKKAA